MYIINLQAILGLVQINNKMVCVLINKHCNAKYVHFSKVFIVDTTEFLNIFWLKGEYKVKAKTIGATSLGL